MARTRFWSRLDTAPSLVAREDVPEFGFTEETQRYVPTVFKRPLQIHALINLPDLSVPG
jgi:hypothetical protein